jgi:UDP-N-acetyl-alpha-D-quinovosamine dehydrogenase
VFFFVASSIGRPLILAKESQDAASSARILVTGATGLVGRHLLSLAPAVRLRAAVRAGGGPRRNDVEYITVGNIDAETDWSIALAGVNSVVHLAARVHVLNPTPTDVREFEAINIVGTAKLAVAAAQAGVRRFVFLSTVKVNGETTDRRAFRADDPPNPSDAYARSKLEGERELTRIGVASGMQTVFIRSPLVYGPGVRANFLRLLSWAYRGLPLPLSSIHNARSLVSVWNLCDLIVSVLRYSGSITGPLMVSDGCDVSTPGLIRLLARALHKPARLFPMPIVLLRQVSRLLGAGEEFTRLCSSLAVDITDTRRQLGWSPGLPLETGLRRTADWYLDTLRRSDD